MSIEKEIYGALKNLTLHDRQGLFVSSFRDDAIRALKEAQSQSDATWSGLPVGGGHR